MYHRSTTVILEAQFADASFAASDEDVKPPTPFQYDISECGDIVRLTCELIANLNNHEKHAQRIETLQARVLRRQAHLPYVVTYCPIRPSVISA